MDSSLSSATGDEAQIDDPSGPSEAAESPDGGAIADKPKESPPVDMAPGRDRGRTVALGTMAGLIAIGVGLIVMTPGHGIAPPGAPLALTSADVGDGGALGTGDASVSAPSFSTPSATPATPKAPPPPVWRVANLKVDGNVEVSEGTFGKRGFVQALTQAGLPRPEIKRIARAFESSHRSLRPQATDSFVLAKDRTKGTAIAFELQTSPLDVWQVRLDDPDGERSSSSAKKLDLYVEHKRVAAGVVVGGDIAKSLTAAGLRAEIVDAVGDAIEAHVEGGALRAGTRMRVSTMEDWVEGAFARVRVEAVELLPAKASPLRLYFYERDASVEGSHRHAPAAGFYNAKAQQPVRGAFRSPLPLARVTSRFNPKRMHPVLHVVMPHNGVDYAGTTGTPVYASAAGTVVTAGNGGPCGNMVEIDHAGGITTAYCHLKGFAQGLHSGQKVESHQLVGYVGQTGRVTGPHLHFVAKKNGVFIDPQGLKMDGVRVLPPADREAFARKRVELDAALDAVALPSAPSAPNEADGGEAPDAAEADTDEDLHEE